MNVLYWKYDGYVGDQYTFAENGPAPTLLPGTRTVGQKYLSFLTQLGFGPGYFNNSGRSIWFQKSVFKTEEARNEAYLRMSKTHSVTVYPDDVSYFDALKAATTNMKRLRKQYPY